MTKEKNEADVKITSYGDEITKKLKVFYNPKMDINRDISLLVIKSYFNDKKIKYCDPMAASGVREIRFKQKIPECFEKLVLGDISNHAIKQMKKNFDKNSVHLNNVEFKCQNALNTIIEEYWDFIEIDPFGSPIPFLDSAIQRIKHNGILSVTTTDTATLCGVYPKNCFRKYGIETKKTLFFDEIGIRNLITYCQIQGAKYAKVLTPILSFAKRHFYKIFFKVEESKSEAYKTVKNHRYFNVGENQVIEIFDDKLIGSYGKIYTQNLCDSNFLKSVIKNLDLIENDVSKKIITNLYENEKVDTFGYYNIHKLLKYYKLKGSFKFEDLVKELKKNKYLVSRAYNNNLGLKTNAPVFEIVNIIRKLD